MSDNLEALNNAISDIASRTYNGIETVNSKNLLHNGKVSTYNWSPNSGKMAINDASKSNLSIASSSTVNGKIKVTYNFDMGGDLWNTVANIQNTFVHEFYGHGINKWGDANSNHYKVYDLQQTHETWKNTTKDYQDYIKEVAKPYYYNKN